ncbi:MAG: PG0541 family transporter-associated protein [Candidatus Omnitrophota bacterium]
MKMVMVTYNEAIDIEIMEILNGCGLVNYTKVTRRVYGKGTTSGTHLGDQIWPGLNYILFVACEDAQAKQVILGVTNLRKTLGKEGVKAFVMPLEEVT